MARAFVARADGRFMCALETEERGVLRQVAEEVTYLIRTGMGSSGASENSRGVQEAESDDPLVRLAAESAWDVPPTRPVDSALARLFPAAHEAEDEANEFRRFSQRGIADGHVENLATIVAGLEASSELGDVGSSEIIVSRAEALAWLKGLTLVRLVLGDRMGLRGDTDFEALQVLCGGGVTVEEESEPGAAGLEFLVSLYEFLTWLQESLVQALNSRSL